MQSANGLQQKRVCISSQADSNSTLEAVRLLGEYTISKYGNTKNYATTQRPQMSSGSSQTLSSTAQGFSRTVVPTPASASAAAATLLLAALAPSPVPPPARNIRHTGLCCFQAAC
jgi:hypothetical protein